MAALRPDLPLTLVYVAHGLRSAADDDAEAAHVATLADRLGQRHVVRTVTVARSGDGIEADARRARHAALEDEADRCGARFVLHGHHAEDQAETVLLRLARGTGLDGLSGMAPVSGRRLRPLLDVRRADLHRAAESLGGTGLAGAARDPMNDDASFGRVRVRRDVLPVLADVAPDPVGALTRLAALARDDADVLEREVAGLADVLPVVAFGPARMVPLAALRALPVGLARRVVRVLLPEGEARSAGPVERILQAHDTWRATLPGPLDVQVDRGWLIVRPTVVAVTDVVELGDPAHHGAASMTVQVEPVGSGPPTLVARTVGALPPGLDAARMRVTLVAQPALRIRARRDGDRVRTPGGTRPLGDVLADAGVPLALRDLLPVVVDAAERVVWVPGVVVDTTLHAREQGARE